ncbi:hypothetical protein EJB05_50913, partial [Eragrostis curvula]
MASPAHSGAAARKHLRVLLPFSRKSLRIPDELAEDIGAGEAHVVIPFGKGKVRRVEVGRDGDGAFLGRGWPEFADACGVGAGWLLVLRHHGAGVLTVKAFDDTGCLRMQAREPPAAAMSNKNPPRRPQFINVLPRGFMDKMEVPSKIVQDYISKEHLDNQMAIITGTFGKKIQIQLEMNQSSMFFAAGWSQLMAFHGITEANYLLLRHEGNMMFTVKVFEPEGCQRDFTHEGIGMQQTSALPVLKKKHAKPFASGQKRKKGWPNSEGQKKPKTDNSSLQKASLQRRSFYDIGPPSWIKKVINTSTLENHLALARDFCDAIGLRKRCTVTLKTSMDSTRYWQVQGAQYSNNSYMLHRGWRRFCQENSLKEGDVCTFHIIETALWHVVIMRCKEKINQFFNKGKQDRSICEEPRETKGSMTSVNKASSARKCVFDIGPPAWIKKTINTSTIKNVFSLPLSFCVAIGLREPCIITLKTSMSSSMSWQARVVPKKYNNHMCGSGWKRFCQENGLKEGDICTFNVIETTLWHVIIVRR